MAELSYRDAVIRGIAQEMRRDPDVVFLGEDVAKLAACSRQQWVCTQQFGPLRVLCIPPISESRAILGAARWARR